ncbi:SH3 domain-containing protein [Pseudochrobactrum kiredjianiae]
MKLHMRKTEKSGLHLLLAIGLFSCLLMLPSLSGWHPVHAQDTSTEGDASSAEEGPSGEETSSKGEASSANLGASGLPVPRFVSLKPARVNIRVGPGRDYAVSWLYTKSGLPVEIIQEYDNWRRIRDVDGTEGWVYQSLLAGKRTAIVAPWQRGKSENLIDLYASASDTARIVARAEAGVIGNIRECTGKWCQIETQGTRGWIKQALIWGAYPDEVFD